LTTPEGIATLEGYQAPQHRALQEARAAALHMWGQRLRLAVEQAALVKEQIEAQARTRFPPLMRLKGVQALTAGTLAVILGPGRRGDQGHTLRLSLLLPDLVHDHRRDPLASKRGMLLTVRSETVHHRRVERQTDRHRPLDGRLG